MNDFTLNGAEIDGEPRIWLEDDCFATFNLTGNGSALFATPLGGLSSVVISPVLPPQIRKFFTGDAQVALAGGLPLSLGYSLIGNGQSALSVSGELLRKAMASGNTASVIMQSDFTATVFTPPKADFFIQMQGSADLLIAKPVFGEYIEPLVICETDSRYQPDFSTHHGVGLLRLRLNATAKLNVWMYSPNADCVVSAVMGGEFTSGKKIAVESDTLNGGVFVKGDIGRLRYINIDGEASITMQNKMDSFKRVYAMPRSPNNRTLFVSKQDRTLTITG